MTEVPVTGVTRVTGATPYLASASQLVLRVTRERFRNYSQFPTGDTHRVYGASDYTVTADGGDYTIHIVVGLTRPTGCTCLTSGARPLDSAMARQSKRNQD
jgi:hypothetical protein